MYKYNKRGGGGREGGRVRGNEPWRKWVWLTCSHDCTLQCATLGNNVTLLALDWNLRERGKKIRMSRGHRLN